MEYFSNIPEVIDVTATLLNTVHFDSMHYILKMK